MLKLYRCFILTKLTPSTVHNLRSSWSCTLFFYKVYFIKSTFHYPVQLFNNRVTLLFLEDFIIAPSALLINVAYSNFFCLIFTDVSFNLKLYWSRHCDTTVDHPACEQDIRIELTPPDWQTGILTVIRILQN